MKVCETNWALIQSALFLKRNRLRWFGHVLRKDEDDWVRKCIDLTVEGKRGRGRPRKRWIDLVTRDMTDCGLVREDACDRMKWRRQLWVITG